MFPLILCSLVHGKDSSCSSFTIAFLIFVPFSHHIFTYNISQMLEAGLLFYFSCSNLCFDFVCSNSHPFRFLYIILHSFRALRNCSNFPSNVQLFIRLKSFSLPCIPDTNEKKLGKIYHSCITPRPITVSSDKYSILPFYTCPLQYLHWKDGNLKSSLL